MSYEKRIKELTEEINMRSDRLQKFVAQNTQKIEQEKAIIQQKIGARQELLGLAEKPEETKEKNIVF